MSINVDSSAVVASAGEQIDMSALVSTTATDNPEYLVVTGLDRNEYTAASNGDEGTITGDGATLGYSNLGGDANTFGMVFTYDAASGQYVNSTYGDLSDLVLTASTDTNRNEAISIFASNDSSLLTQYAANPYALTEIDSSAYVGTVNVVTQPGGTGTAPAQATPDSICSVAQSFVGQAWNDSGCWVLACNIAAEAGASLPITSTLLGVDGTSNGEWIVAYDGPAGQTGDWEDDVTAGEMVAFQTSATSGHITTVVSGSGADAEVIDNITYENSNGSIVNAANDGSPNDIIIEPAHLASQEFAQAIPGTVVIYELDTPTVTPAAAVATVGANDKLAVDGLFSATSPDGHSITSYQVYNLAPEDSFLVDGVATAAQSAATAVTETASGLSDLLLQAGGDSLTDTLEVRAYNGSYWGDWQAITVDVTGGTALPATIVSAANAVQILNDDQPLVIPLAVSDTEANVAANLSSLEDLATSGELASITFTNAGKPTLALTATQYSADTAAIAEISGTYILSVTGSAAAATITGIGAINELSAGNQGGAHVLNAGAGTLGTDSLYGGSGADTLNGSTAADGTAILIAGSGANVLNGGLGYDTLYGGGDSVLNAGSSNQELLGGFSVSAHDTLNAGSGNYEFLATATGANVLHAGSGTGDFLEGGAGADTLTGSTSTSGSAILIGGTGANVLIGGVGADTLVGGGHSSLLAGTGSDQVLLGGFLANSQDTLNAGSSDAVLGVGRGNNVLLAGTGNATLYGGSGNDLLSGGGGDAVLVGGSGHSTLQAGSGSDTLVGGGQSLMIGGNGANGVSELLGGFSASAHDTLEAGTGSGETLAVQNGNNQLFADTTGAGSNDTLVAGVGNDTLYGAGYGTTAATSSTTNFVVGAGNTMVLGGSGSSFVTVQNGSGHESIDGGSGSTYVDFTGHTASDATISTASNGVTTISFADSSQTAVLTNVTGVLFEGSTTAHSIA